LEPSDGRSLALFSFCYVVYLKTRVDYTATLVPIAKCTSNLPKEVFRGLCFVPEIPSLFLLTDIKSDGHLATVRQENS